MLDALTTVLAAHESRLLVLAIVIGALVAFAAASVLARVRQIAPQTLLVWFGASLIFGCGVWAALFVALSGFRPAMPASYGLAGTLAALAVSVAGSIAAWGAYIADRGRRGGVVAAGLALGVALVVGERLALGSVRPAEGAIDTTASAWPMLALAIPFSVALFWRAEGSRPTLRRIEATLWFLMAAGLPYLVQMAGAGALPAASDTGARLGIDALTVAVGAGGFAVLALNLASDTLERHALQHAQEESGRLLQLVGAAFEGIVIHRDGVVLETNEAFRLLGGWREEALAGGRFTDLVADEDPSPVERALRGRGGPAAPVSCGLLAADGRTIPVEIVSRSIEHRGAPALVSGVRDLSGRLKAEEQIRHLAHHDALTGLPNRFLLTDRLTNALSVAKRNHTVVAVLHLNLDRFKAVNDLLGHEAGDQLLVEVGRRLEVTLRDSDTLARLGGDEFVIIQPLMQQPHEAAALSVRVLKALATPFDIAGQTAEVNVSVGIAVYPQDGDTAAELLHNADTALSRAKAEGDGTFLFFEAAMDRQIQERRHLEIDLRQAVQRGELELHYQPLFDTHETTTVVGFEALVRWHHPSRGMISPADFIPLAEECGLIGQIGRFVLERACTEAASWPSQHRVAVNLSPAQFRQADLPQMVASILEATGLPPQRLELEITEGVLIDNADRAVELLNQLKRLGLNISLDDFGTGYSSLSYLRRFPFDKIKIDQSFIGSLHQDHEAVAIVEAIVSLGRNLHLSITAEGVETEAQLQALRRLDCNQVQGFLLGRPMPKQNLGHLVGVVAAPETEETPPGETAASQTAASQTV